MADAKIAIQITLEHEGGFQKDPNDHANWSSGTINVGRLMGTKYGITAVDMPGVDIASLTPDQATAYYMEHYWKQLYSQIKSQSVANKLFDMGVLFGVGTAVEILQITLGLIPVDGNFGPETLERTNWAQGAIFLSAYEVELELHAQKISVANPLEAQNLNGWVTRIRS